MEFKGTKKWVLGRKKGSYQYISGERWDDFAKVVVKIKGAYYDSTIGEANAKLIVAAPELLEALKDLVKYCEENDNNAELELAYNALNKALK